MKAQTRRSLILLMLISILIIILPKSSFADLYPAQFQIPEIKKHPKLDGKLDKGEWDSCQEISDFVIWTLDKYERDPVTAWLGFDQDNLYVGFRSTFSDPEAWRQRYEEKKPIDSHLWGRNNVRVQLSNEDVSIHLMAAPSGSRADFKNGDMAWNGAWEFETSIHDDHWIAELKIPFSELDLENPPVDGSWDLMLGRTNPADGRTALWNGNVKFSSSKMIYALIDKWPYPVPGNNQLELQFRNRGKTSETVNCEIELIPFMGKPEFINQKGQGPTTQFILPLTKAPKVYKQTIIIPAGENNINHLNYELPEEGSYYATATCYDESGQILQRNKGFWFSIAPNKNRIVDLSRLTSEGLAICRKKSAPVAKELNQQGRLLWDKVQTLSSEADEFWKSGKWNILSEKVDQMQTEVYQFLNAVRFASIQNWEQSFEFGVSVTHSLNKVRRDGIYREAMATRAKISAARNEYESFQLVILPFGQDIKSISLSLSDLVKEQDQVILNSNIEVSFVDYNLIDSQPSYLIDYEGWHPDPLIPAGETVNIDGSEISRPFWITVYVPSNTPAGVYSGTIDVMVGGSKKQSIPIDVEVWDFVMPTEPHLKTHTWDNMEIFSEFYNLEEVPLEWYLNFCEVLLKNHLSPGFAGVSYVDQKPGPNGEYDFSKVEKVLEFCMERGLTRYSMIQMRKGFYEEDEKKDVYDFIHEYAKFLRDRGWLDKGVIEVWDEPTIVRLPAVIQRAKDLRAMDPDLTLQLFAFGHKEFDFWKPEAKQYGLIDLIDVWAPFPLIESPESQAAGIEIWSYFCTLARSNAPNFYVDRPAIYQRTIGWHSWMFGIDAFEHWSTNYFWRNTLKGKPMNEKWPNRPWDSRTYMDFHGEGQLVYPGPDGACFPSMRLEIFRDGLDDYEYLYRLKELVEECENKNVDIDLNEYHNLLNVEEYLLVKYPEDFTVTQENTIRYPGEPERFFETRKKLAIAILKLQEIVKN